MTVPAVVATARIVLASTLPQNRGAVSTVVQFWNVQGSGMPGGVRVEVGGRAEAADEDVEHRPDRDGDDDQRDEVDERLAPVEAPAGGALRASARCSRSRSSCDRGRHQRTPEVMAPARSRRSAKRW